MAFSSICKVTYSTRCKITLSAVTILCFCLMLTSVAFAMEAGKGIIQVFLTSGGKPFIDAELELYKGDDFLDSFTYRGGLRCFEISTPPGEYEVLVRPLKEGYSERLLEGVQVTAGTTVKQTFELGTLGSLRIRVAKSGQPYSNANVVVRNADGYELAYLEWNKKAQAFQGSVVEGAYSVNIDALDEDVADHTIEEVAVKGGTWTEQAVDLRAQGRLTIKVTSGGKPYKDVQVEVSEGDQSLGAAGYDEDNDVFVMDVPEGYYDVTVEAWDANFGAHSITAQTGEIAAVEFAGQTALEVTVKGSYGVLYATATVEVERDGESITTAYWDKKARKYQAALPEGTYDILINPDGYYTAQRLKDVELKGENNKFDVELFRANTNAKVDVTQVISQAELVALAQRYKQTYYRLIPLQAKSSIDDALAKLEKSGDLPKEAVVNGLSASAIAIGAIAMSREMSVTLGAAAVVASPKNTLAINNFGALLRLLSATEESVLVLNYGRLIAPDSPLILTNLANSVLELGDDDTAETFYLQALRHDSTFAQAHHGLATIYQLRGDVQKAIEHLFKAAQQYYTPTMRRSAQQARDAGGAVSQGAMQQASSGTSGSGASGSAGSAAGVGDQLVIPRLPNWSTRDALTAGKANIDKWSSDIVQNGLTKPLEMAMNMRNSSQASSGLMKAYGGPYSQVVFQIESYGNYLQDRVTEIYDQYLADVEGVDSAWSKDIEQIGDIQAMKTEAAFKGIEGMTGIEILPAGRKAIEKMDDADQIGYKDRNSATDRYFQSWKSLFRNTYEEIARLTEEYWIYTEGPASRIYDKDTANYVGELRRLSVYSSFVPLAMDLPARMLLMEIGTIPIMRPPGERAPEPEQPEPMDTIQAPPPKNNNCPFRDGSSFNANLGFASMQVGCETVEVKAGSGVEASMTYNFKHKYVSSLYAGVGVSAGAGGVNVGASAGIRANFGPNGEVLGVNPEAGTQGSLGPLGVNADTGNGLVVGLGPVNIPASSL